MPNTHNMTCIQIIFQVKGTELTMKNSNQFMAMGISPFLLFSGTIVDLRCCVKLNTVALFFWNTIVNLRCCVKLNMAALTGLCNKKEP